MVNVKNYQIKKLFNYIKSPLFLNFWIFGIIGEGIYREYNIDLDIIKEVYYKNNRLNGEFKLFDIQGILLINILFKNNKIKNINYLNKEILTHEYYFVYYDPLKQQNINFYNQFQKWYKKNKYKKKNYEKYKKKTN